MSVTQNEYYVELSSFDDLARLACALQEYPKWIYSEELDGTRIISSSLTLANTLLIFYIPIPKSERYVSYQVNSGKEICDIVESTKTNSNYARLFIWNLRFHLYQYNQRKYLINFIQYK